MPTFHTALQELNAAAYRAFYASKGESEEVRKQLLDAAHLTDRLVDDNAGKAA